MKRPYAFTPVAMTLDEFNGILAQVCEIMELEIKPAKRQTDKKMRLRLRPLRSPAFAFYWSYDVEIHLLLKGLIVMIYSRPNNHFSCMQATRLQESLHMIELINSIIMLQETPHPSDS
jgi:hypothetical protein